MGQVPGSMLWNVGNDWQQEASLSNMKPLANDAPASHPWEGLLVLVVRERARADVGVWCRNWQGAIQASQVEPTDLETSDTGHPGEQVMRELFMEEERDRTKRNDFSSLHHIKWQHQF